MDDVARPALAERHVEGVQHELAAQVLGHRPADNAAAERVQHDGQIEEAGNAPTSSGWPTSPTSRRSGRRSRIPVATGGDDDATPPAHPGNAGRPHQPGNPLPADRFAIGLQLGMNAGCAIGASRDCVNRADPLQQGRIGLGRANGARRRQA